MLKRDLNSLILLFHLRAASSTSLQFDDANFSFFEFLRRITFGTGFDISIKRTFDSITLT